MKRQFILFVSHCILNTASKVSSMGRDGRQSEEETRIAFLHRALDKKIQLIQLPCPEFTLYGSKRWGHTKEQFDNPFYRDHCQKSLSPFLTELEAYLDDERFQVLGLVGIEDSPSCGVCRTCSSSAWGGEFYGNTKLAENISKVSSIAGQGVMIEVLNKMLKEREISLPIVALNSKNPSILNSLIDTVGDEEL